MKDALSLIYYTVMVPIWIIVGVIDGISLLFFGSNIFPPSVTFEPLNDLIASVVGRRMSDAIAGICLLGTAYYLGNLVRKALQRPRKGKVGSE